jgi:hypothetical protein
MQRKYEEEITANLKRSEASIQAAKILADKDYYDFVASRAYYAAFYAATALLLCEELEFSKHSGVISFIHRDFIRTGRLDKRYGKDLNWLFELRSVGDYGALVHVSQQDAEKAISVAEAFLRAVEGLIHESEVT